MNLICHPIIIKFINLLKIKKKFNLYDNKYIVRIYKKLNGLIARKIKVWEFFNKFEIFIIL